MHNLEFKARLDDAPRAVAALRALGAADAGLLVQRDTYFRVPSGRLKLRETPVGAELIEYVRDESGPAMMSHYTPTPVPNAAAVLAELAAALGVRGVVEKTRHLWLWHTARIHLDHVAGLGDFLEIEVVEPRSDVDGRALLAELLDALALDSGAAVRASYIDLLEAREAAGEGEQS